MEYYPFEVVLDFATAPPNVQNMCMHGACSFVAPRYLWIPHNRPLCALQLLQHFPYRRKGDTLIDRIALSQRYDKCVPWCARDMLHLYIVTRKKTTKLPSDSALVATQIVYIDNCSTDVVEVLVQHDNSSRVVDTNGVLQNPPWSKCNWKLWKNINNVV